MSSSEAITGFVGVGAALHVGSTEVVHTVTLGTDFNVECGGIG